MKKEAYKKSARIKRLREKNPQLSFLAANATLKLMRVLGPLSPAKRRRLLKVCAILIDFEP